MTASFTLNRMDINLLSDQDCKKFITLIDYIIMLFNDKKSHRIFIPLKNKSVLLYYKILDKEDFEFNGAMCFLNKKHLDDNKIEKLQELKRQLEYTLL